MGMNGDTTVANIITGYHLVPSPFLWVVSFSKSKGGEMGSRTESYHQFSGKRITSFTFRTHPSNMMLRVFSNHQFVQRLQDYSMIPLQFGASVRIFPCSNDTFSNIQVNSPATHAKRKYLNNATKYRSSLFSSKTIAHLPYSMLPTVSTTTRLPDEGFASPRYG